MVSDWLSSSRELQKPIKVNYFRNLVIRVAPAKIFAFVHQF